MPAPLTVTNLTKVYPAQTAGGQPEVAVDKLSFTLKKGEVLGLLGPNGAGKTTTMQMLLGLTTRTSGSIEYFGKAFPEHEEEVLSRINFASAYAQVQGKMSVQQNLMVYGHLYRVKNLKQKIAELTALLEIDHLLDSTFWQLSSGQQTRVILAKSLINDPQLLLMDEPTASLDPDIVQKILGVIRRLQREKGVSILYTSHNMEEVTRVCDRVMFLHQGKLVASDTPLGLTKLVGTARLILTFDNPQSLVAETLDRHQLEHHFVRRQMVEISLEEDRIPGTLFDLKKAGVWVTSIDIQKPTLEDVFLSFAQKERS